MNYLFIILPAIAIASVVCLYILTKNAHEIKEDDVFFLKKDENFRKFYFKNP